VIWMEPVDGRPRAADAGIADCSGRSGGLPDPQAPAARAPVRVPTAATAPPPRGAARAGASYLPQGFSVSLDAEMLDAQAAALAASAAARRAKPAHRAAAAAARPAAKPAGAAPRPAGPAPGRLCAKRAASAGGSAAGGSAAGGSAAGSKRQRRASGRRGGEETEDDWGSDDGGCLGAGATSSS
jgi:hypothetical protein